MILSAEKYQRIELIALLCTAILKFILMDRLNMKAVYISGTCIFWSLCILHRYSTDKPVISRWGFRQDNFRKTITLLLPIVFLSIIAAVLYGYYTDKHVFSWHILPVILLYPLWGVFQQFFMLGIIAQNLSNSDTINVNKFLAVFITAFLFSLIHYPGLFLMIFAFLMEVMFVLVYLKWRNLWALGIAHG